MSGGSSSQGKRVTSPPRSPGPTEAKKQVIDVSDWLDGGGAGAPVDVAALLDSRASDLLGVAVGAGALVSLGLTSDGGALGVTVTVDGRWRREYHRDADSLVE